MIGFKPIPAAIAVGISLFLWFVVPVPNGLEANAWLLFSLFVGVIAAIIGKAMPIGAIGMIAITLVAVTGVTADSPKLAIKDALSSFSSPLIWLIGIAIMISRAIIKTGLGARIGYYFIALFGKKTLGIAYALSLAELILAPVTPSNTARGGGIMHPIMRSVASSFGSSPEDGSQGKIGKYLALVNYHANPITSAMFITATAPNPLIVKLIADATGKDIQLSWSTWALAMLLPGLVAILLMPLVLYFLFPPEIKKTPDAQSFARHELNEMGSMKTAEKIMLGVFALLLILWAGIPAALFGKAFAVHSATTALIGLVALLITGVLTWEDIITEKSAWNTIVWFSALVMMAGFLNKLGMINWFADNLKTTIDGLGLGWQGASALLLVTYLYLHYMFASTTAHITALFVAFYAAGLSLGAPPMVFALLLAAASSIMMTLTHYATGTSPVIYGSGYTSLGEWWRAGLVMSIVNLTIWVFIGLFWWKILGLI